MKKLRPESRKLARSNFSEKKLLGLKAPQILVSGSIVYDTIFELNSAIRDQVSIENGTAGKQNLMFTAKEKEIYFGGTAGNICYGLGLLKEPSFVFSAVGLDFDGYKIHLQNNGGIFKGIKDLNGYTATYFGMTDPKKEQLGIFQSGAYGKNIDSLSLSKYFSKKELTSLKCGIFAAGTAKSITKQINELRKLNKNAIIIFDPGQMLAIDFTEKYLKDSLKHSDIAIFNDTECNILHNKFGFDLKKIFSLGVRYVIETKGREGSVLYELKDSKIKEFKIKSQKVKKVLDPTGAGDAYRAGIIHGIVNNLDIRNSMILASKLGSECVKHRGGQTYKI